MRLAVLSGRCCEGDLVNGRAMSPEERKDLRLFGAAARHRVAASVGCTVAQVRLRQMWLRRTHPQVVCTGMTLSLMFPEGGRLHRKVPMGETNGHEDGQPQTGRQAAAQDS